jgi:hypothetical protein
LLAIIYNDQFLFFLFYIKIKGNDYPRTLAISLIISLLVTISVIGGALVAYYYWRRANNAYSSNDNYQVSKILAFLNIAIMQ